jgi:hypothetical protein
VEHLWSRAVETRGNGWQTQRPHERRIHAETVATGRDQLPARRHGKEGVDGSSPSEGLKMPASIPFRVVCVDFRVKRGSRVSATYVGA